MASCDALLMRRIWHTSDRESLVRILRPSWGTAANGAAVCPWSCNYERSLTRSVARELVAKTPLFSHPETDALRILRDLCFAVNPPPTGSQRGNDRTGQGCAPTLATDHARPTDRPDHGRSLCPLHGATPKSRNVFIHNSQNRDPSPIHPRSCGAARSEASQCRQTHRPGALYRTTGRKAGPAGASLLLYGDRNAHRCLQADKGDGVPIASRFRSVVGFADSVWLAHRPAADESPECPLVLDYAGWLVGGSTSQLQATQGREAILFVAGCPHRSRTGTNSRGRSDLRLEWFFDALLQTMALDYECASRRTMVRYQGYSARHLDLAGGAESACIPACRRPSQTRRARGFLHPEGSRDSASRIHAGSQGLGLAMKSSSPLVRSGRSRPRGAGLWWVPGLGYGWPARELCIVTHFLCGPAGLSPVAPARTVRAPAGLVFLLSRPRTRNGDESTCCRT